MTNTETQRLARKWVQKARPKGDRETLAAMEHIMATTEPLTMADVGWDDEKHRGAGATDTNGKVWIMSQNDGDYINCVGLDMSTCGAPEETLTPNGKRYELREVGAPEQPEHPATLETLEDYENAPVGTVVAEPGYYAWTKGPKVEWWRRGDWKIGHEMAGTKRQVLRWGWGK